MIHSFHVIDISGISLLDYHSTPPETWTNDSIHGVTPDQFFQIINSVIDEIQGPHPNTKNFSDITRMLMVQEVLIFLHYHAAGKFFLSCITDKDDEKDKIFTILQSLGRRFWAKHKPDLEGFRHLERKEQFKSFIIDIQLLTKGGSVAETHPQLIVNINTLERLKSMAVITSRESDLAKLCDGKTTLNNIAKQLNIELPELENDLKKMETLDILKI